MTTLVTGGTGQVGSRFVPRLARSHDDIRLLVRDRERARSLELPGAEIVEGDLRDGEVRRRGLDGIDAVVHLAAAFRGVPDEEAVAVNEAATVALAHDAIQAGVRRFVMASTSLIYGPGRGRPAREEDEPEPTHAYPQSKASAETALLGLHRSEALDLRIVRLAFVYGEGDPHLEQSLMWARSWAPDKRLHMIHHADVGQALLATLRTDGLDSEVFNAADDAPVTAYELFDLNREPIPAEAADRTADDPWEGILDTRKIRSRLGFRPIYPTVYTARAAGTL